MSIATFCCPAAALKKLNIAIFAPLAKAKSACKLITLPLAMDAVALSIVIWSIVMISPPSPSNINTGDGLIKLQLPGHAPWPIPPAKVT